MDNNRLAVIYIEKELKEAEMKVKTDIASIINFECQCDYIAGAIFMANLTELISDELNDSYREQLYQIRRKFNNLT